MSRFNKRFIAGICIIFAFIILLGCLPGKQSGISCSPSALINRIQSMVPGAKKSSQAATASTSGAGPTRPHPPVKTGNITTGSKTEVASQQIGTAGGTITISKPGDPLDGFALNVPPQSYAESRSFKISYAPITSQTFGSDINPISPMITVDNGGGYSDHLIYVRVPAKVPEGSFAMGFIYDEKTKQLEGMPLVGLDKDSITLATRHFSSFFVSMIEKTLLKKDADSGFRPGIDDWQFVNYGSYIAPGGHCEGQSLAAMWYYCTQPDGNGACLFNRYDNNGDQPSTPKLQEDDSLGYRFCSVLQSEKKLDIARDFWNEIAGKQWQWINNKWELKDVPGIGDENIFNLFSYSIRATGEPQEVVIWSNAGGGHSMIVYRVVGNALYISDPNYPGNTDRKIIFYSADGRFKPYNSGANREEIEAGHGKAYEEIQYCGKSTIISWDKIGQYWTDFKNKTVGNNKFPQYQLNIENAQGNTSPLTDGYITNNKTLKVNVESPNNVAKYFVFRDGAKLAINNNTVELNPGNNLLGFYIVGNVNNKWKFIDFKYFNIKYEGECKTPPPANIMSKLQQTTLFHCELLNLPSNIEGHGSMQKWVPGFKWQKHFYIPGNAIARGGEGSMPIKWSGTSFSGGGDNGYPDTLTGNVCYGDGKILVSFDYATNDPKDNLKFSVKNLPCDPKYFMDPKYAVDGKSRLQYMSTDAPLVKKYVTRLEWTSHEERPEREGPPQVWDAKLVSADWTRQCGFMLDLQ